LAGWFFWIKDVEGLLILVMSYVEHTAGIEESLKRIFGFSRFKGQQKSIVENVLAGKDTFVIMPTGGGKSLCYQLPALLSEGTAIIVSPLIALMKNQVDSIRGFGEQEGVAHFFNSSLSKGEREKVKQDIVSGKTKMLFVAPESLTKEENIHFLHSIQVSFFAIDEAHCISEWGHDFRPEYRRLRAIIEEIDRAPIIALTATATPKVQHDILKNLGMSDATLFKDSFNRSSLYYEIRPKVEVNKEIIRFIRQHSGKSGIIYCQNRKKVEEIAELLQLNGISAVPYHAGLDSKTRNLHQDLFLHQEVDVIVATIAFGMGIDKPDIRFIIHHDIPKSLESYYQETGRAGRDGGEGICVAFYDYNDVVKLEKLLSGKPLAEQEIHKLLLQEVVAFAESGGCRRQALLHYFGEHFGAENCQEMCDNCAHPKETFPAKEALLLLFDTLLAMKGKYKMAQVLDVLQGRRTNHTETYRHTELPQFGKGKAFPDTYWLAVMRQALVHDFLFKEVEHYGTLMLSKKALAFIESPFSIDFFKDRDFASLQSDELGTQPSKGGSALDALLLALLRDLRKQIARQRNLPPFVIFQDFSLEEMATAYPITMEELKQVSGVGEGKAMKFGKAFVELIARHVEEHEIDRPMDVGFKSVANKSAIKVAIIQSIDRKIPLDVIARNKDLELAELIHELEAIVQAGIRLDLDYYVGKLTDADELEGIYDLLRESDDADIQVLIDEYGDVYSEDELRVLQVKFLSDMGN
jgi:ATP-dependent DNA helicase RecQ